MLFEGRKVSDVGSSNPIVARLAIQTSRLLQAFPLAEENKQAIFAIYGIKVQERLVACDGIRSHVEACYNQALGQDLVFQAQGRAVTVPHIIDLDRSCETFLYQSKSALRDLAAVFNVLYSTKFDGARYDKILTWAAKEFGNEDKLTETIDTDHETWIKNVIDMRNAVEHPGGHSGDLIIDNIRLALENDRPVLRPPTWRLAPDGKPASIITDMSIIVTNILEFAEDILMLLLAKQDTKNLLAFAEIPVEQRDEDCPVRLRVTLNASLSD